MTAKQLPLEGDTSVEPRFVIKLLAGRLAAYRKARQDLSQRAVPPADLYLLANQFRRHKHAKVKDLVAEIDQELATVMPSAAPRPRRYA